MDTIKKTGNVLLTIIILLYSIWFMGIAFWGEPWLHLAGGLATILLIVRIVRGDD
jgi:hypothetical protein